MGDRNPVLFAAELLEQSDIDFLREAAEQANVDEAVAQPFIDEYERTRELATGKVVIPFFSVKPIERAIAESDRIPRGDQEGRPTAVTTKKKKRSKDVIGRHIARRP